MKYGRNVAKALFAMQAKRAGALPVESKRGVRRLERAVKQRADEVRRLDEELASLEKGGRRNG